MYPLRSRRGISGLAQHPPTLRGCRVRVLIHLHRRRVKLAAKELARNVLRQDFVDECHDFVVAQLQILVRNCELVRSPPQDSLQFALERLSHEPHEAQVRLDDLDVSHDVLLLGLQPGDHTDQHLARAERHELLEPCRPRHATMGVVRDVRRDHGDEHEGDGHAQPHGDGQGEEDQHDREGSEARHRREGQRSQLPLLVLIRLPGRHEIGGDHAETHRSEQDADDAAHHGQGLVEPHVGREERELALRLRPDHDHPDVAGREKAEETAHHVHHELSQCVIGLRLHVLAHFPLPRVVLFRLLLRKIGVQKNFLALITYHL